MVAVRCCWMTVPTSTPGTLTARASLIASSSRGGWVRATGELNQVPTSSRPASVTAYITCPSPSAPWPSTSPSRSRRDSVV